MRCCNRNFNAIVTDAGIGQSRFQLKFLEAGNRRWPKLFSVSQFCFLYLALRHCLLRRQTAAPTKLDSNTLRRVPPLRNELSPVLLRRSFSSSGCSRGSAYLVFRCVPDILFY